ncbi:Ras- protein Rab-3A [Balamuthia mandrillaris]
MATVQDLPCEILVGIFDMLPTIQDSLNVTHVCQLFYHVGPLSNLWKQYLERVAPSKLIQRADKDNKNWKAVFLQQHCNARKKKEARRQRMLQLLSSSPSSCEGSGTQVDYKLRVGVVGDESVGKTNFISLFTSRQFMGSERKSLSFLLPKATVVSYQNVKVNIEFWDQPDMVQFRSDSYVSRRCSISSAFFLLFDVTNKKSFDNVKKWRDVIHSSSKHHLLTILVANKTDLKEERVVSCGSALELANELQMEYVETSLKKNEHVKQALHLMVSTIMSAVFQVEAARVDCASKQKANCLVC